jgi:phosphate starvation-inducible protein PhoH and related proteins
LSTLVASTNITLTPANNRRLAALCGPFNEHLQQIEEYYNVQIRQRSNVLEIIGHPKNIADAENMLNRLYDFTSKDEALTADKVFLLIKDQQRHQKTSPYKDNIANIKGAVKARGSNQQSYLENIRSTPLVFGVGPAGTGKTYLAVACALEALESKQVKRLIFVRPAVEAGENLGFLPGDLEEKVLPYLRPLYDALDDILSPEQTARMVEQGVIEIAPLAYMRGRTLNDAFIILDEAQNTTINQMKMFLTRIGFGTTAVVTGDVTQIDLPRDKISGLIHATKILQDVKYTKFNYFTSKDVVRHPLVQEIINAYAKDESDKT